MRARLAAGDALPLGAEAGADADLYTAVALSLLRGEDVAPVAGADAGEIRALVAGALLADELQRYDYPRDLHAMRVLADAHPADYWNANLYNRWMPASAALRTARAPRARMVLTIHGTRRSPIAASPARVGARRGPAYTHTPRNLRTSCRGQGAAQRWHRSRNVPVHGQLLLSTATWRTVITRPPL